ncbi:MAG: alpha/beta hydrolase [Marinilabiliales bacterium]|nr:MAG: alpha/beta hydrolase [Marinilabiliales bacterium]
MTGVYFVSGLGADEKVFQNLHIHSDTTTIQWVDPAGRETISEYALRLTDQIKSANSVLVGVSFGGIIALEIARLLPVKKVILISSMKSPEEIPSRIRFIGKCGLQKVFPAHSMPWCDSVTMKLFGAVSDFDKVLLKTVLRSMNTGFVNWAFKAMSHWQGVKLECDILHVHGTSDKIIPIQNVRADIEISDGTHFMISNKADAISEIINKHL